MELDIKLGLIRLPRIKSDLIERNPAIEAAIKKMYEGGGDYNISKDAGILRESVTCTDNLPPWMKDPFALQPIPPEPPKIRPYDWVQFKPIEIPKMPIIKLCNDALWREIEPYYVNKAIDIFSLRGLRYALFKQGVLLLEDIRG